MVYELLAGKPPFTGISTNDLLTKHLRSPVPPLQAGNRNVTDEFAALLPGRCWPRSPRTGPQSMDDVLGEMHAAAGIQSAAGGAKAARRRE